jgi:hypothetical protein
MKSHCLYLLFLAGLLGLPQVARGQNVELEGLGTLVYKKPLPAGGGIGGRIAWYPGNSWIGMTGRVQKNWLNSVEYAKAQRDLDSWLWGGGVALRVPSRFPKSLQFTGELTVGQMRIKAPLIGCDNVQTGADFYIDSRGTPTALTQTYSKMNRLDPGVTDDPLCTTPSGNKWLITETPLVGYRYTLPIFSSKLTLHARIGPQHTEHKTDGWGFQAEVGLSYDVK